MSPPETSTLSLHDALPIYQGRSLGDGGPRNRRRRSGQRDQGRHLHRRRGPVRRALREDRKSTRLNSSHLGISYAVFCLKKKKKRKLRCMVKAMYNFSGATT